MWLPWCDHYAMSFEFQLSFTVWFLLRTLPGCTNIILSHLEESNPIPEIHIYNHFSAIDVISWHEIQSADGKSRSFFLQVIFTHAKWFMLHRPSRGTDHCCTSNVTQRLLLQQLNRCPSCKVNHRSSQTPLPLSTKPLLCKMQRCLCEGVSSNLPGLYNVA